MYEFLWLVAFLSLLAVGGGSLQNEYDISTLPSNITTSTDDGSSSTSATPPDNKDCKCVPYYLCNDPSLTDNQLICEHYLYRCCKSAKPMNVTQLETSSAVSQSRRTRSETSSIDPQSRPTRSETSSTVPQSGPTQIETSSSVPQSRPTQIEVSSTVPQSRPTQTETSSSVPQSLAMCGQRNPWAVESLYLFSRTRPYTVAHYMEVPWIVALLQSNADAEDKNVYLCGGSLIHPKVVLTAAQCVQGKDNLKVRAGDVGDDGEERNVTEVVVHEHSNNDLALALLFLESPFNMTTEDGHVGHVGLICLPEGNEDFYKGDCFVSGWSKSPFEKDHENPNMLRRVYSSMVPRADCQEALRKSRLGSNFTLHSSAICNVGVPGERSCESGRGSPLVCSSRSDSETFVLAGVIAWDINCGGTDPEYDEGFQDLYSWTKGQNAVYTNVTAFLPWVNRQLRQRGISLA